MGARTPGRRVIGRALRAQARDVGGDLVLLGAAVAALVISLPLAASIPSELADAPAGVRDTLTAPLHTVLATSAAVLAAVYGSFRYTVDRRDGVIAQRLMLLPRWAVLLVRLPTSAIGGAAVALVALLGGHVVLWATMGGIPLDAAAVGATLALGAVAGLWGVGIGMIVQAHLVALFVTSLSLGVATLVALFWSAGAASLPLLAFLQTLGFDVTAVGLSTGDQLYGLLPAGLTAAWVLAAVGGGSLAFLSRDVT
ncbi:hypothetical protein [Microbacterium sufflavum]